MNIKTTAIVGLLAAGVLATSAFSASHADKATMAAVKARQSVMSLLAFNIGPLAGMAKGNIPYDADTASAAAANMAKLASMDMSRMWIKGTDNETLGKDATEALPAIWEKGDEFNKHLSQLGEATSALEGAAGGGLDSLRAAMGNVGKACGSCHENFRQKDD